MSRTVEVPFWLFLVGLLAVDALLVLAARQGPRVRAWIERRWPT